MGNFPVWSEYDRANILLSMIVMKTACVLGLDGSCGGAMSSNVANGIGSLKIVLVEQRFFCCALRWP